MLSGNCEPRKEAVLHEVHKEGSNKGKFFWKCRVYPYCDFFLWQDQAKVRETGLIPTRIESAKERPKVPSFTQKPLTAFGYQITPTQAVLDADQLTDSDEEAEGGSEAADQDSPSIDTPCRPASKRKRDAFECDEFSDMDSEEERQLVVIADESAKKPSSTSDQFTTPVANRTHDVVDGLPTPSVTRTLFSSTAKRHKQVSFEDIPSSATLSSATTTPTLNRSQVTPSSGSPGDNSHDVTDEIMELLRGQGVDAGVLTSVQGVLATAARKTKGIERGRDLARTSLKAKDDKIARLQDRIVALENKEKMHQARMTDLKAGLMDMYHKN